MGRSSFYSPNEKITLEILDSNTFLADENLGQYTLDISGFVKQNDDGMFDNGVFQEQWVKVQLPNGSGTQGELQIEAKFFSTALILEDKFVFSPTAVNERLFYVLISWRRPDNAFEFSYGVARFFNFSSAEELQNSFGGVLANDKALRSLDLNVWSTALVIGYLKILFWNFENEWKAIAESSERWISSQIYDVEDEDRLFDVVRNYILQRFNIKLSDKQKQVLQSSGMCDVICIIITVFE